MNVSTFVTLLERIFQIFKLSIYSISHFINCLYSLSFTVCVYFCLVITIICLIAYMYIYIDCSVSWLVGWSIGMSAIIF